MNGIDHTALSAFVSDILFNKGFGQENALQVCMFAIMPLYF